MKPRSPSSPPPPSPQKSAKGSAASPFPASASASAPASSSEKSDATEPVRGLAAKKKKKFTADDVAREFGRGDITLAQAIGVSLAQRDVLKARAFTFLKDKRPDEARPLLEGLVALNPYDHWPLTALASIKLDVGEYPLALKLLDRAVQVSPTDVTSRSLRAEVRFRSGDEAGAQADLAALDPKEMAPAAQRARAVVPTPPPTTTTNAAPATNPAMTRPPSKAATTNPAMARPPSKAPPK